MWRLVLAALLVAPVALAQTEAEGGGGATTVSTTAPITGDGSAGSPVACTSAGAAASGCVTTGAQTIAGQKTFNTATLVTEGTEALPGLAGEDDADTGIRLASAANTIAISTGGTTRFTLNTTGLTLTLPLIVPAGSASATSVNGGTANTGLYFASSCVTVSVGGSDRTIWCSNEMYPGADNAVDIGRTDRRWRATYTMGLNVGASGTTIASSFSGTGTLDFADTLGVYGCEELTVTCTGAVTTNTPVCVASANGAIAGGNLDCRVSAANTCAIQYCGTGNPASRTVRATSLGY